MERKQWKNKHPTEVGRFVVQAEAVQKILQEILFMLLFASALMLASVYKARGGPAMQDFWAAFVMNVIIDNFLRRKAGFPDDRVMESAFNVML